MAQDITCVLKRTRCTHRRSPSSPAQSFDFVPGRKVLILPEASPTPSPPSFQSDPHTLPPLGGAAAAPPSDTTLTGAAPGDSDLVRQLKDQLVLARRDAMHKGSEAQMLASQVTTDIWCR